MVDVCESFTWSYIVLLLFSVKPPVRLQINRTSHGSMLLRWTSLLNHAVSHTFHVIKSMSFLVFKIVLEEAGRPMHIKEIKQRIIDRGLVQSKYRNIPEVQIFTSQRTDIKTNAVSFTLFTVQSRALRRSCIERWDTACFMTLMLFTVSHVPYLLCFPFSASNVFNLVHDFTCLFFILTLIQVLEWLV